MDKVKLVLIISSSSSFLPLLPLVAVGPVLPVDR